jgi:hypothetical protein
MTNAVRLANVGDTARVLELLAAAHPVSPFAAFSAFCPDMARASWLQHLASTTSLCLVYAPNDTVQGVFVTQALDHPSVRLRLGVEVVKWIDPNHRGRAWFKMLRWYERWAVSKGCKIATISDLKCPGYAAAETHYVKVL